MDVSRRLDVAPMSAVDDARALACAAARVADEKKAADTIVLFVGDVLAITDYFVICSAPNRVLVHTIVDDLEVQLREQLDRSPLRVEGVTERQWVLIDYCDVVVHVFSQEVRDFYEIERLYRDVPKIDWRAER
jgi:ribosome-associated protein